MVGSRNNPKIDAWAQRPMMPVWAPLPPPILTTHLYLEGEAKNVDEFSLALSKINGVIEITNKSNSRCVVKSTVPISIDLLVAIANNTGVAVTITS